MEHAPRSGESGQAVNESTKDRERSPRAVVVCAIDLHGGSALVLRGGLDYAVSHGAVLHVLTVAEPNLAGVKVPEAIDDPVLSGVDRHKLAKFVGAHLAKYREEHPGPAAADLRVEMHVEAGRAAETIAAYAKRARADLIVIATHGRRGIRHLVVGSCAEKIVRTASCPVLVMRETRHDDA
jgi:nucleotide-binding universal stress UspA family protein